MPAPTVLPPGPGADAGKGIPDGKGCKGADAKAAWPQWSAKIIIQAEQLHPEFPAADKVLGPSGSHVQHVRLQPGITSVQLRGRGSRQAEPETGQELQEPMALWLVADSQQEGRAVVEMALDLLSSVYEEHKQWCLARGHTPPVVEPTVIENPATPNASPPGVGGGPAPVGVGVGIGGPSGPGIVLPNPGFTAGYGPCQARPTGGKGADWGGKAFPGKGVGPY